MFRTLPVLTLLISMPILAQDFDFLYGSWKIHNTYLKDRLAGSSTWLEFEATGEVAPILNGLGNFDSFHAVRDGKAIEGATLRLYNPTTGTWSIYWADNVRAGILQPPMVGKFQDGIGEFFGDEELNGRKVLCRFRWTQSAKSPRWEQAFSGDGGKTWETNWIMNFERMAPASSNEFTVYEFRRYTIRAGERERFATYFESYFPEAIQQLGALAFGQFLERDKADHFTWIRGFHDMAGRAAANQQLYYGPLWKEHKATMNGLMTDSDNVLLLKPLTAASAIPVLPSFDPVAGKAQGVVVAQVFPVQDVAKFARAAEESFGRYRGIAGLREAGILATLDEANNFPQLPVRGDGPFVVWLCILENEDEFRRVAGVEAERLEKGGVLRGSPELIVLDPTSRSRMRWVK